jgi:hypothetical protein
VVTTAGAATTTTTTTTTMTDAGQRSDEVALRECIERITARHFGASRSEIATIDQARSQFSSFYAADVITVRLSCGRRSRCF